MYMFSSDKSEGNTELGKTIADVEMYLNNPNKGIIYSEIRKKVYDKYKIN
jgi:hypothetical protein